MGNVYDGGQPDGRVSDSHQLTPGEELFRSRYRQLSDAEIATHDVIKKTAAELWNAIEAGVPEGRDKALAKTKLQESIMWAVRGLTG